MILSSDKIDSIISVLYAKEYQIIPIKGYSKGIFEDVVIAFGKVDNDDLRRDSLFILDHFHCESAIIKYIGESDIKRVSRDGTESLLEFIMYNTNSDLTSYIHNGMSFSFAEKVRYWKPTKKEDLKEGMIVEYSSNNKWYEKKIKNTTEEWEKLFKLLIKYEKVRVPFDKLQVI